MTSLAGVILPFPGGVVRSGSKVGSNRYKNMVATTNDPFDPTLRAITQSQLPAGVNSVLEIVLDGTDGPSIEAAMRAGIRRRAARGQHDHGGELRREARAASLPPAEDPGVSDAITLSLAERPVHTLVADCIAADRLADLDAKQIAELPVLHGGRPETLGTFFKVRGGRSSIVRVEETGAGGGDRGRDAGGELTIDGSVGRDLGLAMSGAGSTCAAARATMRAARDPARRAA